MVKEEPHDVFFPLRLAGTAPSGVIVSVLSVITVLCLLILLLFCYKDKLKLLSGRLDISITPLRANTSVVTPFNHKIVLEFSTEF